MGFGDWGLGVREWLGVWGLGFGVWGLGLGLYIEPRGVVREHDPLPKHHLH